MKKLTAILCTTMMTFCLTACGGSKDKDISIDTAKLAKELAENTVTSDTLVETASEMLPSTYFYEADAVTSAAAYASSGATACEVVVIESKDASSTDNIEKLFKNRVDTQSSLYASYNAGEVDKLDKAIIESTDVYTVLCVCDDTDKANEILKGYGF